MKLNFWQWLGIIIVAIAFIFIIRRESGEGAAPVPQTAPESMSDPAVPLTPSPSTSPALDAAGVTTGPAAP